MQYKYGIFLNGELVKKCNTPLEAYEYAIFAYSETGKFHEIKLTW